jgi:short-subunit dehydrogenase
MKTLTRYGPWALVAGASEGIGAAFATALVRAGINVVLVARRLEPLDDLAATLKAAWPIETRVVPADLATDEGLDDVRHATDDLEIGLVVANAAYAPIGPFLRVDEESLRRAVDVNCATTVRLARTYLPPMAQRRRGGFIIMSSLAGQQGSPGITTYAATKAFGAVLAEGLWAEMRPYGVDVLACTPGAVATPGLSRSKSKRAPGTVTPDAVVAAALGALGRRPRIVPGGLMKVSSIITARVLPRRASIALIAKASGDLTSAPEDAER